MEIRPNFGGGSPGFIRGGVSFFLQGGFPDFPKQGRFYPSGPPPLMMAGIFGPIWTIGRYFWTTLEYWRVFLRYG